MLGLIRSGPVVFVREDAVRQRQEWPAVHSGAAPALMKAELRLEDPEGTADEAHGAVGWLRAPRRLCE
jgi:hypothetical protein